ncbi:MAG: hypothetical protein IT291_08495 [Deltaproteobacteria bacterium]|nr:hypothetical protein [Deltaproteobacteria bacterium]
MGSKLKDLIAECSKEELYDLLAKHFCYSYKIEKDGSLLVVEFSQKRSDQRARELILDVEGVLGVELGCACALVLSMGNAQLVDSVLAQIQGITKTLNVRQSLLFRFVRCYAEAEGLRNLIVQIWGNPLLAGTQLGARANIYAALYCSREILMALAELFMLFSFEGEGIVGDEAERIITLLAHVSVLNQKLIGEYMDKLESQDVINEAMGLKYIA